MSVLIEQEADALLIEERGQGLWITLNRPARRNALTSKIYAGLIEALHAAARREDLHYVAIRGAGDHFCSGGDLEGFDAVLHAQGADRGALAYAQHEATANALTRAIWDLPQPLIVAARGFAVGAGAQLILAADLAIVSDTLRLSIPQVHLAHTADHGESWYLPRRVGMTQAARLLLLGERLNGTRAAEIGIACECTDDAQLDIRLGDYATALANGSRTAQRETKRLLRESWQNDLAAQSALEREALARSVQTPDFLEAIAAFGEKRAPIFSQELRSGD